jgi:hypothetical protein
VARQLTGPLLSRASRGGNRRAARIDRRSLVDETQLLAAPALIGATLAAFAAITLVLAVPATASSLAPVTSRDRAATRAYLKAGLTYEQSLLASAPASNAAIEALAHSLESECPGVLANAPEPEAESDRGGPSHLSARKRGEVNREQRQRAELEAELLDVISLTLLDADRDSAVTFANTVASLHWGNPGVTAYVHAQVAVLEWNLRRPQPAVCADMKTWASDGYRTLPSATKGLFSERAAVERPERRQEGAAHGRDPGTTLKASVRTYAKTLVHRLANLVRTRMTSLKGLGTVYERLRTVLGLRSQIEESVGPPKGATVIESGKTAVGGSFTIWINPTSESTQTSHSHCALSVEVEEREERGSGSSVSGTEACLSRTHPEAPRLECDGNHWQIAGQTVEGAQTVTLTLSNGHQISSPVAIVPAADGGPEGFYYQVLRRPAQTPVLLTELDASGTPLRTIKLSPKTACPQHIPKPPKPPEPLPGGGAIATGHVPSGPRFTIIGERVRFMGHIKSGFSVTVTKGEPFLQFGGESELTIGGTHRHPSVIQLHTETGCQPHRYTILYGLLTAPKDIVLARTATGITRLRRVAIPKIMHLHGVLAYAALAGFPSEILVRTPAGKTIFVQKLTRWAHETKETCEGEAEGSPSK